MFLRFIRQGGGTQVASPFKAGSIPSVFCQCFPSQEFLSGTALSADSGNRSNPSSMKQVALQIDLGKKS